MGRQCGAIQTTNDAYVRAELTRLSSRVSGEVLSVGVTDFQRVNAGDLLVQLDPADYEALVAQAEANVAAAQAALDNLANQIELQYATIAQAQAAPRRSGRPTVLRRLSKLARNEPSSTAATANSGRGAAPPRETGPRSP